MPSSAETLKEPARADDRLSPAAFADPPVQTRPGCFWAWLNGSITAEQVTRDLEAMKQGGMRGGEIWDVAAMTDPDRRVPAGPPFLGPKSTRLIVHAIREADRLGLEVGLVASSGWNAGGSWIKPEHAGKGLYQSTTTVKGPTGFHDALPLPELPKNCPRDEQGRPSYLREVADPEAQEQFLYDWNRFVSDRLIESHYATGRKVLQSYGVKLIAEAGGPGPPIWNSNPVDGIQALGAVDIPRGEFWIRHRGIFLVKEIAAAAHVYDKRVVDAESFTTWRRWVDGPLNHMVLQRDKPVAVWGWAAPGEQVTVSFAGQTQTTSADQDRTWKITIAAMPAHAQPQKMTVQGKDETLTLDNILVGDVWVLGGQSNMECPLTDVENGQLEIVSANYAGIRILTIPAQNGDEEKKGFPRLHEWSGWFSCHFRKGDWDVCSPEVARQLSAIGYVFARRIHTAAQIPIGVGVHAKAYLPELREMRWNHGENDNNGALLDKAIAGIEAATDSPTLVDLKDFESRP